MSRKRTLSNIDNTAAEGVSDDESDDNLVEISTPSEKNQMINMKKSRGVEEDDEQDSNEVMVLEKTNGLSEVSNDENDDRNTESMAIETVIRTPRQWQLSDGAMITCLQAYVAWRMRLQSFVKLPVIYKNDDEELWESRINELKYLGEELLAIWSTGCSNAKPLIDDDAIHVQEDGDRGVQKVDPMAIAYCLFFHRVTDINLSPAVIDEAMVPIRDDINELISHHKKYNYIHSSSGPNESLTNVNNVACAVQNAYCMLQHAASMSIAIDPSKTGITPAKTVLYTVDNMNSFQKRLADAKEFTRVIIYLVQVAVQRGYRRYRDGVYEQHVTPEGHPTSYWKRVCSMTQFIFEHTSHYSGGSKIFNTVANRTIRGVGDLEKYLIAYYDPEFPFVFIDRHVFSFRNGIYFCATRTFRPYTDGLMDWGVDSKVSTRHDIGRENLNRKRGIFGGPHVTNASANYFDVNFVDYTDRVIADKDAWFNIPTPTFDKLLDDQKIPIEAKKVVYGLIGRTFYEVGELDDWQIILWFLGRAGTGKSTICKIPSLFYQPDDVAVISNNIEEQFGLGSVYDKLVFIAPEVKKDFRLNQAEFQSMVSGEKMSIARKFKDAAGVMFKVPGIVAGNAMPGWMDNSDSLGRRIALLMCMIPVGKVDGSISAKLASEVAALLFKFNLAYHMMLEDYGSDGVWDCLPSYFKTTRNELKAKTQPMYHFLKRCEHLQWGTDLYIPLEQFKNYYNNYVKQNNLKRVPWTEELYVAPIADHQLKLEKRKDVNWMDKVYPESTVIVGVTWMNDSALQPQQTTLPHLPLMPRKHQEPQQLSHTYAAIPKNLNLT
jgi:hypothetical protein